jgi:TolA-binding protein
MDEHDRYFELLARERRGMLQPAELAELDSRALCNDELSLARRAQRAFEDAGAVRSGDDQRCDAIAARVKEELGIVEPRAARRSGGMLRGARRHAPLVLAALVVTGAAAAGIRSWQLTRADEARGTEARTRAQDTARRLQSATPLATALSATESADPVAAPSAAPSVAQGTLEEPARKAAPAPAPLSAAELFEQATRERSAGNWAAAEALYRRLVREHPSSEHAALSLMVLGKQALARGSANAALGWFQRYQRSGHSSLLAEAMWGEAQALKQLGREAQHRKVVSELKRRFPLSPYTVPAIVEE